MDTQPNHDEQVRKTVHDRYSQVALEVLETNNRSNNSCCDSSCCGGGTAHDKSDPITAHLYSEAELGELPVAASLASLGCGNPTALAELKPGETVLDLGSGGGIDVLLTARRVGPTGFAFGLDMTDAMLELAERNRVEANVENVRFLKGFIEDIPLPNTTVDVVISNCVINLSVDKEKALSESFRVLKSGGRFAISDIVIQGQIPENLQSLRSDLESWAGCVAGALEEETYRQLLAKTGFEDIQIEVTRRYSVQDAIDGGAGSSFAQLSDADRADINGKFVSACIRARKP